jgi:hypothetical protein
MKRRGCREVVRARESGDMKKEEDDRNEQKDEGDLVGFNTSFHLSPLPPVRSLHTHPSPSIPKFSQQCR